MGSDHTPTTESKVRVRFARPRPDPTSGHGGMFRRLGPGIITGAADDDPSGIGTYSQVGAAQGTSLLWMAPYLLPLAFTVQEATARLGLVTGKGLATLIRERFPRWVLVVAVVLVASANTLNIAADLSSMGAALHLLVPVPAAVGVVGFAVAMAGAEVLVPYRRYSRVLRWFGLALLAYVGVLAVVHVNWSNVLRATAVPGFTASDLVAMTAIAGTTISPYLFFWQTSEEVEEQLDEGHHVDAAHLAAMRVDVGAGMGSGVIAMFAIMCTAAVTLHGTINSAEQAAVALEPLAGRFATWLFAAGIIGLGLLAVPVLAGSTAYAVAEAFRWHEGLHRTFREARGFYLVVIGSMGLGLIINAVGVPPMRALYWSAIFNGVTAPPLVVIIAILAASTAVMGRHRAGRWSLLGLTVTAVVMTAFPIGAVLLHR